MILLDIILILSTLSCIIYCYLLYKRMLQIQNFKNELKNIFKRFDESVLKADQILNDIKKVSEDAEKILREIDTKSYKVKENIVTLMNKADQIADDLATSISSGNNVIKRFNEINLEEINNKILEIKSFYNNEEEFFENDSYDNQNVINQNQDKVLAIKNIDDSFNIEDEFNIEQENTLLNKKNSNLNDNYKNIKTKLSQDEYYKSIQRKRLENNEI